MSASNNSSRPLIERRSNNTPTIPGPTSSSERKSKRAAQKAYQIRSRQLQKAQQQRIDRIISEKIGNDRQFAGTVIIPDVHHARSEDTYLLEDIRERYESGTAAVYWADGSKNLDVGGERDGLLSAAVAWEEKDSQGERSWQTAKFELGRETGASVDAEMYALAAALHLAIEHYKAAGTEIVQLVRVFSDNQTILSGLAANTVSTLGPAVSSRWALQNVYDAADWLAEKNVKVQIVWVKGHAKSEGNIRADSAAHEAISTQIAKLEKEGGEERRMEKVDVSWEIQVGGDDAVEEWYYRVNRFRLLNGDDGRQGGEKGDGGQEGGQDGGEEGAEGSADMEISDDE